MHLQALELTSKQRTEFWENGFLVLPNVLQNDDLLTFQQSATQALAEAADPKELESETGYPGAPLDEQKQGGKTVRRLLGAYQRSPLWQEWSSSPLIINSLQQLFQQSMVYLSQTHHNCLMTKSPQYSSDTGWHQDIRYWSFEQPELITAWLALGAEKNENGGLWVVPGSHRLSFSTDQFDEQLFFRTDTEGNKMLLGKAQQVPLNAGDLLFFHCRLLHSASRNHTQTTKFSLVFTYHAENNHPRPNTRSASLTEIALPTKIDSTAENE
ncbi:phytanoyl-CoA dioxygenase family protein [Aliikangiella maris]|uniref:Phytanoyl-CoA dioxygenase family protein n=2 Tax=Aliikangiella maris TaxID=3162458 RepID=A0ABV2BWG1_9GAMM